jgi:hypothetical protein
VDSLFTKYVHAEQKKVCIDIFMFVFLLGEQGMVDEAQKVLEEAEALKKVAAAITI